MRELALVAVVAPSPDEVVSAVVGTCFDNGIPFGDPTKFRNFLDGRRACRFGGSGEGTS